MGVKVLTEEGYFALQQLGEFDTKSSSWLKTPAEIRELGGAIYGDRRYNRVFIGHNGAEQPVELWWMAVGSEKWQFAKLNCGQYRCRRTATIRGAPFLSTRNLFSSNVQGTLT